ncbi:MAG TPA: CAP domain-containing protein [Candidatus Limnocylindrales bacterium]|nr:CAP domain-containing protein [Candidatus Limnocylindrales bacterium]
MWISRMARKVFITVAAGAVVVAVVGLALPVATLARPDVGGWLPGTFDGAAENELVALTAETRVTAAAGPLGVDAVLASVARWRSRDMVERGYFSHDIPDVGNVFRRLDADGYCYELAGENIGWDVATDTAAPAAIQAMFMDSPGHRRNVLDARWDVVGVGAFKAPDGRKMFAVLFADRCGTMARADERRGPASQRDP